MDVRNVVTTYVQVVKLLDGDGDGNDTDAQCKKLMT